MRFNQHKDAKELSPKARRNGLIALLVDTICMYTGFFMVIPLLSVHYVDGMGWAAISIGIVLATRQFLQQGLSILTGAIADQLGAKLLICIGLVIRISSFMIMAWADTFGVLLFSIILAAVGGALFESPRSAAIAALTLPEERQRFYSLSGVLGGIGMALGPLIGSMLINVSFPLICFIAALCFGLNLIQSSIMLPNVRVATNPGNMGSGLLLALKDRPFVVYTICMMGYWFMWVQLSISIPLLAALISGNNQSTGWLYSINAFVAVVLQYPLLAFLSRRLKPFITLIGGVSMMALSMGIAASANSMLVLIIAVVFFALASAIVSPTQQTVTASLSNPVALGSFFGIASLSLAIGGGLGNFSGGLLHDIGEEIAMPAMPWIIFCVVGVITTLGLATLYLRSPRVQESHSIQ